MNKKKQTTIIVIIAFILLVSIIGLLMFSLSRDKITPVKASALRDTAWQSITPIVDNGGAAIIRTAKGDEFLVLGKSNGNFDVDLRNCSVKIAYEKSNGERTRFIKVADEKELGSERGWNKVNESNRPVAVYKIKTKDSSDTRLLVGDIKKDIEVINFAENKFLK